MARRSKQTIQKRQKERARLDKKKEERGPADWRQKNAGPRHCPDPKAPKIRISLTSDPAPSRSRLSSLVPWNRSRMKRRRRRSPSPT